MPITRSVSKAFAIELVPGIVKNERVTRDGTVKKKIRIKKSSGSKANNPWGTRGRKKCAHCRARKRGCDFEDDSERCKFCVASGLMCGAKILAEKARYLQIISTKSDADGEDCVLPEPPRQSPAPVVIVVDEDDDMGYGSGDDDVLTASSDEDYVRPQSDNTQINADDGEVNIEEDETNDGTDFDWESKAHDSLLPFIESPSLDCTSANSNYCVLSDDDCTRLSTCTPQASPPLTAEEEDLPLYIHECDDRVTKFSDIDKPSTVSFFLEHE